MYFFMIMLQYLVIYFSLQFLSGRGGRLQELLALKVLAATYERWLLTKGFQM